MMQEQPRGALRLAGVLCSCCLLAGCDQPDETTSGPRSGGATKAAVPPKPNVAQEALPASPPVVSAARAQIGKTTVYDPSYVRLDYPGGDVRIDRGVVGFGLVVRFLCFAGRIT